MRENLIEVQKENKDKSFRLADCCKACVNCRADWEDCDFVCKCDLDDRLIINYYVCDEFIQLSEG